jgi:metacaspase-1
VLCFLNGWQWLFYITFLYTYSQDMGCFPFFRKQKADKYKIEKDVASDEKNPLLKGRAILFGLNYANVKDATLRGCINDVNNIANFIQSECHIPCDVYTDDRDKETTSARGIIKKLYEVAALSYRDELDFVWIHYSGHGTSVIDKSGDEADGRDECLVPNDFKIAGVISDDLIEHVLRLFNPKTRVLCVFDCCNSGTIADLRFSWEGPEKCTVENAKCEVKAKVITISGCLDHQTSADAYNVSGTKTFEGALTACLLKVLKANAGIEKNVFDVIAKVRGLLKDGRFDQVPKLCSTYDLTGDKAMFVKV